MIVENTSSGRTLVQHGLKIVDEVLCSSTRFVAGREALQDPWKRKRIAEMETLFRSILDARERVMLEMNVPPDKLQEVIKILPCMRSPTVSSLFGDRGYAVKAAVRTVEAPKLIPQLLALGATDILEYEFKKVVIG